MIEPHEVEARASPDDPIADLLMGLAAAVGAERWVVVVRHGEVWTEHARTPSHRDSLWRLVASELGDGPGLRLVETADLGDAGRRLRAAGVERAAVATFAARAAFGFLETPDAAVMEGRGHLDLLTRLGALVPRLLEATWRTAELEALGRWLPTLDNLGRAEIEESEALRRLGELSGAAALILIRPEGLDAGAAAAWRSGGGRWQTYSGSIEAVPDLELPGSAPRAVHDVARLIGLIGTEEWTIGTAPGRRPVALALSGGRHSVDGVSVLASLFAAAGRHNRDVAAARTNALLQERARIASVIHEGITQVLTNVAIQMEVLDRAFEDPKVGREMLSGMRSAVLDALDDLRGAILELTPAAPDWSDLAGGLGRFVEDFAAQWGLDLSYGTEGREREVEPETLALVFGFVQEALSNVRKHAGTPEADLVVVFGPDSVSVTVADKGEGFDPGSDIEEGFRRHQGLTIMRTRARLAGARFEVDSSPGEGTRVRLEVQA